MPEESPLRITVIFPGATRGGAEMWQERLHDKATRWQLRILTLAEGPTAEVWRARATPVNVVPVGAGGGSLVLGAVRSAALIRRSRPELIMAHGVKAALVACGAGFLTSTRVAWVRHDESFPRLAVLADLLCDASIASASSIVRPGSHPFVLPPAPGGAALSRAEAREALGMHAESDMHLAVMATRLVPYKGIDDALRALAIATEKWELHVFGLRDSAYPDEAERLHKLAAELGVAERFVLQEPRDDVGTLMAAFDAALVLTKHLPGDRVYSEAFSMVAMEAAAAGTAVIATGAVAERFADHAIGVAESAPKAVAAALEQALAMDFQRSAAQDDAARPDLEQYLADVVNRPGAGMSGHSPMSVVTTTLNDLDGLRALAPTLLPQLRSGDEWIVVDAGSTDGSLDYLHDLRDDRIVVKTVAGAGISRGRNSGIAAARHELIACTDAGCVPDAGWLDALRAAADARPDAGLLTGIYRVEATNDIERAMVAVGYPCPAELQHPSVLSRVYGRFLGRAFDPTMPTGRSVAFTRSAWSAVGGFPEHLQTGEDVTFGRAIAAEHPAVLVSDACVSWQQRANLRESLRMYYRYGQGSGLSGNPRLLARDFARIGAYSVAGVGLLRGGRSVRLVCGAGVAAYLSLPLARAARMQHPVRTTALVPAVAALRDVVKAAGAVSGCLRRW